jgi:hypothetical protein
MAPKVTEVRLKGEVAQAHARRARIVLLAAERAARARSPWKLVFSLASSATGDGAFRLVHHETHRAVPNARRPIFDDSLSKGLAVRTACTVV